MLGNTEFSVEGRFRSSNFQGWECSGEIVSGVVREELQSTVKSSKKARMPSQNLICLGGICLGAGELSSHGQFHTVIICVLR